MNQMSARAKVILEMQRLQEIVRPTTVNLILEEAQVVAAQNLACELGYWRANRSYKNPNL